MATKEDKERKQQKAEAVAAKIKALRQRSKKLHPTPTWSSACWTKPNSTCCCSPSASAPCLLKST